MREKPQSTRAASPVAADRARRPRYVHRRPVTPSDGPTGRHLARALTPVPLPRGLTAVRLPRFATPMAPPPP
jgi:hypothetical protein